MFRPSALVNRFFTRRYIWQRGRKNPYLRRVVNTELAARHTSGVRSVRAVSGVAHHQRRRGVIII